MFKHKNLFQDGVRNEMVTHYNRIVIGSFKEFFQHVNTNNLVEVLEALKELNFVLANRAPELASHHNMLLEPKQITAEEVPYLVRAHLSCTTAYNPEHIVRGRHTPEVTNTTSTADSHCCYQGTTNILKCQKLIIIEIMVLHITMLLISAIHPLLTETETPLTQVIIK